MVKTTVSRQAWDYRNHWSVFKTSSRFDFARRWSEVEEYRQKRKMKTGPVISMPGMGRLFDPKYSTWHKVLWVLVIAGCTAGCLVQITERLQYYLKNPVTLDVAILRNETIAFPAITICPGRINYDFEKLLRSAVREEVRDKKMIITREELDNLDFSKINVSVETLWDECMLHRDEVQVLAPCVPVGNLTCPKEFVEYPSQKTYLKTLWGTCLIITPNDMDYRGPETYIKLDIQEKRKSGPVMLKPNYQEMRPDQNRISQMALQFFLHVKGVRYRHDSSVRVESLLRYYYTQVRFTIKEFHFLNTSDKPCTDEAQMARCRNLFMDKYFDKLLNCSLPFLTHSKRPPCSTLRDSLRAFELAQTIYSQAVSRRDLCGRSCKEVIYSLTTDVVYYLQTTPHTTPTIVQIYYPDNLYEKTEEHYAYSFSAFFSDASANLGFFLGFCILTFVEMIEALFAHMK